MANPLAVTLIIGKEGVTDAVERELDALLESHELVKGKVLESATMVSSIAHGFSAVRRRTISHRSSADAVFSGSALCGGMLVGMNSTRSKFTRRDRPAPDRRHGYAALV